MNVVALSGRLTRDPELRSTPSGTDVCEFSIAVDRAGDKVGDEVESGFFDVTCWNRTAELAAQYLVKGSRVGVTGELRFHKWEAQDGTKRSKVGVTANRVDFIDTRAEAEALRGESGGSQFVPSGAQRDADFQGSDDDIPF